MWLIISRALVAVNIHFLHLKNLYFTNIFALQKLDRIHKFQKAVHGCNVWLSVLTRVSWHHRFLRVPASRTGSGLRYGVDFWILRHHRVCVWNCGKPKTHTNSALARCTHWITMTCSTASARIIFIISWYISYTRRSLSLHVLKASQKCRWKHKKGRTI